MKAPERSEKHAASSLTRRRFPRILETSGLFARGPEKGTFAKNDKKNMKERAKLPDTDAIFWIKNKREWAERAEKDIRREIEREKREREKHEKCQLFILQDSSKKKKNKSDRLFPALAVTMTTLNYIIVLLEVVVSFSRNDKKSKIVPKFYRKIC